MPGLNDPAEALLAHYTTAEVAFEAILPRQQLKLSPYSKMRDPLENKSPTFAAMSGFGDQNSDTQLALFWRVQDAIREVRDHYRLLSFTRGTGPKEALDAIYHCSWARPRMWEQYADNHRGVCLVFDRERLLEALGDSLGRQGAYSSGVVTYTAGGFATSSSAMALFDAFPEPLEDSVGIYIHRHFDDFFLLKTSDWESEAEYRFVFRPAADLHEDDKTFVSYGDSLRYVILGERFPSWQVPGVEALASGTGIEVRRARWDLGRPGASLTLHA